MLPDGSFYPWQGVLRDGLISGPGLYGCLVRFPEGEGFLGSRAVKLDIMPFAFVATVFPLFEGRLFLPWHITLSLQV